MMLQVEDLSLSFYTEGGLVQVLDKVGFEIDRNELVAVVGESGCGKSVTALSIMRLIRSPPASYGGGRILFEGKDLLGCGNQEMRAVRGEKISMIFQEPMTSLNPVMRIGDQISESLRFHRKMDKASARERSVEMLRKVGIPMPEQRYLEYPHQFSGGMRQRAMIAMAMSCDPELLIADEPTTALDVTIGAQIIRLMQKMKDETGASILLITHDLGVVAECADRVVVMYLGQVVEEAGALELFASPLHPYTRGLLASLPRMDSDIASLKGIEGNIPDPSAAPSGCRFHPRCPAVMARCRTESPPVVGAKTGHPARCWLLEAG
jgi:oligopeptide/dipeptide ABC transporter ATP-binding protein